MARIFSLILLQPGSLTLRNLPLLILFISNLVLGQISLSITEYRPFPEKITLLDIEPTVLSWSIANRFLLLDQNQRELIELGPFGNVNLASGLGQAGHTYGELVWMGISPEGIWVLDRIENLISHLDYRLNPVRTEKLELRIFPENAALDPWGRMFLLSRTYNSIFIFENGSLVQAPFIDLSREFETSLCLKDMSVNQDGDLAILDCEGEVHFFNRLGQRQVSYPTEIPDAEFLAAIRGHWFVFNKNGKGVSVKSQEKVSIPGASVPVIDVAAMNRSLAVLSRDHILILNAKFK